ncbi:MAG: MOSC domain-containing protein [Ignavibacteriaceae bacterium]
MNELSLSEIFIYPVKSLGGIKLQSALVEERGLKYDRRWMLVDQSNVFFTQRTVPTMALLNVSVGEKGLLIKHKYNISEPLFIPFDFEHSLSDKVVIWNDRVDADFYNDRVDQWFSDILNIKCRLVKMPASTRRSVDKTYAENKIVSFADGYPLLIIGQASLDDLNSRLDEKLPINRFRPNLVFKGGIPFEEDSWTEFKIADLQFRAVKPCARCVITTTNQDNAERNREPLFTLSKYRKFGNKVLFGMNVICHSTGYIRTGDRIIKIS